MEDEQTMKIAKNRKRAARYLGENVRNNGNDNGPSKRGKGSLRIQIHKKSSCMEKMATIEGSPMHMLTLLMLR